MSISFNQIPSTLRLPGYYAEVDPTGAGTGSGVNRSLLIGQKLATGTATAEEVSPIITSTNQAATLFGRGSMLHRMVRAWRSANPTAELYCIPLDDPSGVRASGSIALTGPATASGEMDIYIGACRDAGHIAVGVVAADTAAVIAAAIRAAINEYDTELASGSLTVGRWYEITARDSVNFVTDGAAANTVGTVFCATGATITLSATDKVKPIDNDLPVFAQVLVGATSTVTLIAKHKGTLGNGIDIRLNYYGALSGESTPAGVGVTITPMASGTGAPDLADAIVPMGSTKYHTIVHPYADANNLALMQAEIEARWDALSKLYGHAWTGLSDSFADLATFGAAYNDPTHTCVGVYACPTSIEEVVAAAAAAATASLVNDPAIPLHGLPVSYLLAPALADRFSDTECDLLLHDGITPLAITGSGGVTLSKCITMYLTDTTGTADDAYLSVHTRYTLAYVLPEIYGALPAKFPRVKIVSDGTPIPAGHAAISPSVARAEYVALYQRLMSDEVLVQDMDSFIENLTVEINADNPNRLDVSMIIYLVGQLEIGAIKVGFRLSAAA